MLRRLRLMRTMPTTPTLRPLPVGQALPVQQLSSTAYSDLRHCPYRFFALSRATGTVASPLTSGEKKLSFFMCSSTRKANL